MSLFLSPGNWKTDSKISIQHRKITQVPKACPRAREVAQGPEDDQPVFGQNQQPSVRKIRGSGGPSVRHPQLSVWLRGNKKQTKNKEFCIIVLVLFWFIICSAREPERLPKPLRMISLQPPSGKSGAPGDLSHATPSCQCGYGGTKNKPKTKNFT